MITKIRKWSINSVFLLSFSGIAVFQACEDIVVPDEDIPDSDVSYAKHLRPIFDRTCAYLTPCHNDEDRAGGYSMTNWSNITQPGIISPYDPSTSRLMWRIDPSFGFPIMPPLGKGYLSENQINGIETWILEGALDN